MPNTSVDGDKLQELTIAVAVTGSEMKSLRELLINRFENIDKDNEKRDLAAIVRGGQINHNKLRIAQVGTWTTIVGVIISIAVALSYLLR